MLRVLPSRQRLLGRLRGMASNSIPPHHSEHQRIQDFGGGGGGKSKNKTKQRWTRQEKALHREKTVANQQSNGSTVQPPPRHHQHQQRVKKPQKVQLSPSEQLLLCARNATSTGSVRIVPQLDEVMDDDSTEQQQQQQQQQQQEQPLNIHVLTYCQQEPQSNATSIPQNVSHVVHVQPLLILDLNGILCHRIRHITPNIIAKTKYRPSVAHIANTPIIPRVGLHDFLQFLNQHFCLAVWTSAKPKTAKQLVKLLFPPLVRERLLFVWAQSKCHTIHHRDDDDQKPLFQKPLDKVWKEFPLWNAENTWLMDDSQEKCDLQYSYNTLHPPPLDGRQHLFSGLAKSAAAAIHGKMSDLENEELQLQFFEQFVQQVDSEGGGNMIGFLERNARGHMGWRGPSVAE